MRLLFVLLFTTLNLYGQQNRIFGYVQDSSSSERISDVLIKVNESDWGNYSNSYGYFYIETDLKISSLSFSYVGYKTKKIDVFNLKQTDSAIIVSLAPEALSTENILIESAIEKKNGQNIIPVSEIKLMPSIGGEPDPIKAIQLFPGVLKSIEGGTSFHVRGGDFDQNLILLDGIPVYNINHFFGFLSVFNVDAIKQMDFIRSGFDPEYGGKLSSVLNLVMKDGNQNEFEYKGGISLLSSRFLVEGPLSQNSSMLLSARRTYLDPLISLINSSSNSTDKLADYYFYDLNAKIKLGLSNVSVFYLSAYFGKDVMEYSQENQYQGGDNKFNLSWGNQTYLARWNYLWAKDLFSNISAGYTQYKAALDVNLEKFPELDRQPDISDYLVNIDIDYFHSDNLFITSGYQLKNHHIGISANERTFYLNENVLYSNIEFQLSRLSLSTGFRYTHLHEISYNGLAPRLNFSYQINKPLKWNISYDKMIQPVHKLSFNNILNPGDLFFPSGEKLKPQQAQQYSTGLSYKKEHDKYSITFALNGFYKEMKNLPSFIYNIDVSNEKSILDNLTIGSGKAYGFEIESFYRQAGLHLMVNYSYINSWRKYPEKNNGKSFHPGFDREHYFNVFTQYFFSKTISVAATYNISSGQIINYADQKYNIYGINPDLGNRNTFFDYGQLNDIRSDFLLRLDLSMIYKYSEHWELFLTVYNVFGNNYPIFYEYENFSNKQNFSGLSLGFIPTFGFNFNY